MPTADSILKAFRQRFAGNPRLFHAPGRINLIGEHTDYNHGWVLPAAIDLGLWYAIAPNGTARCRIFAADIAQETEILLPDPTPGSQIWVNYLAGIVQGLGLKQAQGFACVFGGNLPVGAGLSSSAAMECGLAFGLNEIFHLGFDRMELARLAQRSSNEFVGIPCGIMDQFASLMGQPDMAVLLDCRNLTYEYMPAQFGDYALLLVNSRVHHELAESAYGERVRECAAGVALLQQSHPHVMSLRDATLSMLKAAQTQFDPLVYQRCRYVVEENKRVMQACQCLKNGDMEGLGALLSETHLGLQEDYAVSCPELDFLAAFAKQYPGVAGARMMGGGFGGCTLNLVQKTALPAFREAIRIAYHEAFSVEVGLIEVCIGNGVSEMEMLQ